MSQPIQYFAEYKVRQVTRYIVTRFQEDGRAASSTQFGEFDNPRSANAVAEALGSTEPNAIISLHGAGDPVGIGQPIA